MAIKNQLLKWLLGAGFATAASVVMINEGYKETSYRDGAGVWTICYGETKGVVAGMKRTKAQCDAQLRESIETHSKALYGLPDSTPDVVALGSLDMAYNVGIAGFNNSKVKRYIVAKDYYNAGKAVLEWKYITRNGKKYDCSTPGNKICSGLWKRRLIQSDMIGNRISVDEALRRLDATF